MNAKLMRKGSNPQSLLWLYNCVNVEFILSVFVCICMHVYVCVCTCMHAYMEARDTGSLSQFLFHLSFGDRAFPKSGALSFTYTGWLGSLKDFLSLFTMIPPVCRLQVSTPMPNIVLGGSGSKLWPSCLWIMHWAISPAFMSSSKPLTRQWCY